MTLTRFRSISLAALSCLLLPLSAAAQKPGPLSPATESRIEQLLAKMTLAEKLGQLTMLPADDRRGIASLIEKGEVGAILNIHGAEAVNALQKIALRRSRLAIPLLIGNDVVHGYRTIFPIPLAMASSWDPEMAMLSARVAASEARAAGTMWTFAPMVDIARDPRWGRIAEGSGEDPYLGSAMAAAYVRGFQAKSVAADDSVLACPKHFVGYGAAEGGRDYNSADMSEGSLREIYLPPFQAAVEQGAWTLMSAFNSLNGVPATANAFTLRQILREEWHFQGLVVSDWNSIAELQTHGVAGSLQDAALKALSAGVDMDMAAGAYLDLAESAVTDPKTRVWIDDAVRRILRAKFALGLFEKPFADPALETTRLLSGEHRAAARRVAQHSIVLLKNEGNLLPLDRQLGTIAVIGPLAEAKDALLGPWHAGGKGADVVSILAAVRAAVSAKTKVERAGGTKIEGENALGVARAVKIARTADVILVVAGESADMSGESSSRSSIDLPGRQQELIDAVAEAGKPIVLVVLSGRPLSLKTDVKNVRAILWAGFPGTEGGNAIADLLFGAVNPSAKLPVTFPRTVGQIPIYYAHLSSGRPSNSGEKFTNSYSDLPPSPLYPFGFGLSYSKFEYSDLQVRSDSFPVRVSAMIRNASTRAGEEIVQLYLNDPVASRARPVRELKGFQRLLLQPGEAKRVEFEIDRSLLRFWNGSQWSVEPGVFRLWVAPDSTSGLAGSFEVRD